MQKCIPLKYDHQQKRERIFSVCILIIIVCILYHLNRRRIINSFLFFSWIKYRYMLIFRANNFIRKSTKVYKLQNYLKPFTWYYLKAVKHFKWSMDGLDNLIIVTRISMKSFNFSKIQHLIIVLSKNQCYVKNCRMLKICVLAFQFWRNCTLLLRYWHIF